MPEENETRIGLRADMTIDEKPVAIEGVIGSDFFLQLDRPASLGTPISFAYWLQKTFAVENLDIMLPYESEEVFREKLRECKDKDDLTPLKEQIRVNLKNNDIPEAAYELMITAFLANLTITDLLIEKKAEKGDVPEKQRLMFGLAVDFTVPLPLLPNINVDKFSLLIMNAPKGEFDFPERIKLPAPAQAPAPAPIVAVAATGSIIFSRVPAANSTLTLGGDVWTFVSSGSPSGRQVRLATGLTATLNNLETALNAANGAAAKCNYLSVPRGRRLDITFKTVGADGNAFTIVAGDDSHGEVSAATLQGGLGKPAPRAAQGSVTFTAPPAVGTTITLGGVIWTFNDTDGPLTSKSGTTPEDTVTNLKQVLDDTEKNTSATLRKCSYEAKGSTLLIQYRTTGSAGNAFELAADPASKAKVSATTLEGGV